MKTFVPIEKQQKKTRNAYHASMRGSWHGVNPVTRKDKKKTAYNRKNYQKDTRIQGLDAGAACGLRRTFRYIHRQTGARYSWRFSQCSYTTCRHFWPLAIRAYESNRNGTGKWAK
jgi:hypothetical protein